MRTSNTYKQSFGSAIVGGLPPRTGERSFKQAFARRGTKAIGTAVTAVLMPSLINYQKRTRTVGFERTHSAVHWLIAGGSPTQEEARAYATRIQGGIQMLASRKFGNLPEPIVDESHDNGLDVYWETDGKSLQIHIPPHEAYRPYLVKDEFAGKAEFVADVDSGAIMAAFRWLLESE